MSEKSNIISDICHSVSLCIGCPLYHKTCGYILSIEELKKIRKDILGGVKNEY